MLSCRSTFFLINQVVFKKWNRQWPQLQTFPLVSVPQLTAAARLVISAGGLIPRVNGHVGQVTGGRVAAHGCQTRLKSDGRTDKGWMDTRAALCAEAGRGHTMQKMSLINEKRMMMRFRKITEWPLREEMRLWTMRRWWFIDPLQEISLSHRVIGDVCCYFPVASCIYPFSASVVPDKNFEDEDSVDGGRSSSSSSSKAPPGGRRTVVSSVRRPSSATTPKASGETRAFLTLIFLDESISCWVHKMSENGQNCWSVFPKNKDDVFKCRVLSTNREIFSLLCQKEVKKRKIFPLKKLKPQSR